MLDKFQAKIPFMMVELKNNFKKKKNRKRA